MAVRSQHWRPDTCECVIEEWYDPDDTSVPWTGVPVQKCAVHTSVPDDELHDVVLKGENQVKNRVRSSLLELDELTELNDDGSSRFIHGAEMQWEFTGSGKDRKLTVRMDGPHTEKLARLQEQLADRDAKNLSGPKSAQLRAKIAEAQAQADDIKNALNKNKNELKTKHDQDFGPGKVTVIV